MTEPPRTPQHHSTARSLRNPRAVTIYRHLAKHDAPQTADVVARATGQPYGNTWVMLNRAAQYGITARTVVGQHRGRDRIGYTLTTFGHAVLAEPSVTSPPTAQPSLLPSVPVDVCCCGRPRAPHPLGSRRCRR